MNKDLQPIPGVIESKYFCPKCERQLPLSKFYYNPKRSHNKSSLCKECYRERRRMSYRKNYTKSIERVRNYSLIHSYGITTKQYNEMLCKQNGGCAICGRPEEKGKRLMVDHNHKTGKVRGLLCHKCNLMICVEDSSVLRLGISYLDKHNG